uniref:Uncharacterized protein OSJNBb0111K12.18 n=1 Tax=Oryza sativa subsp. japonica TaxID=39947 RepID=Q75IS3_ORYSJ|nr:hypothetical protein [Oryza sativa Japonica Group]
MGGIGRRPAAAPSPLPDLAGGEAADFLLDVLIDFGDDL